MHNDIIHSDTYAELLGYQDHLESESAQSRVFASLYKGTGLAGIGLSAMALVTLPGWGGLALAGAAAGYVGSVLVESRKTGKLMPLPFVGLGLETVLKGVAKASSGSNDDGDDLTNYHYLDAQQKSDYALLLLFSVEIATYLETLPSDTARRVAFAQMRRRFHQNYARYTKESPDLLAMGSDKQSVVDFLLADADKLRHIATQPMATSLPEVAPIPKLPDYNPDLDYTQTVEVPIVEDSDIDPWQDSDVESPMPVQAQLAPAANPIIETVAQHELTTATVIKDYTQEVKAAQKAKKSIPIQMAETLESLLVIGNPGAGKGILVSNAIAHVKELNPGMKIVGIDPKNDPKETGYWTTHFDAVYRVSHETLEDEDYINWFKDRIQEFKDTPEDILYVIDEWTITCRKFNAVDKKGFESFISFMIGVSSGGDSRRKYVWGVGQIPHANSMGMTGGDRAIFKPIAIVSRKRKELASQFTGTSFVPTPEGGLEYLETLMAKSEVGRAIFYNEWQPLDKLENYSGYDRDSRAWVSHPEKPMGTVGSNVVNTQLSFLKVEPERKPSQVQVIDEPSLDTLIVDEIDLDSLFHDTDNIDRRINEAKASTNPKVQCLGELLEWLKVMGTGEVFNNAAVNNSNWCVEWNRKQPDIMPSKAKESFLPFIELAIKLDFLVRQSNTSYRVNLH